MDFAHKLVKSVFNKELSDSYAILFLVFVLVCLVFFLWALYYAFKQQAIVELAKVTWFKLRDTGRYTGITIFAVILVSSLLFVYDTGVDKIVNLIIKNAK